MEINDELIKKIKLLNFIKLILGFAFSIMLLTPLKLISFPLPGANPMIVVIGLFGSHALAVVATSIATSILIIYLLIIFPVVIT